MARKLFPNYRITNPVKKLAFRFLDALPYDHPLVVVLVRLAARFFYWNRRYWDVVFSPESQLAIHLTPKAASTSLITAARANPAWSVTTCKDPGLYKNGDWLHVVSYRPYPERMLSFYREKILDPTVLTYALFAKEIPHLETNGHRAFLDHVVNLDHETCDKHYMPTNYMARWLGREQDITAHIQTIDVLIAQYFGETMQKVNTSASPNAAPSSLEADFRERLRGIDDDLKPPPSVDR